MFLLRPWSCSWLDAVLFVDGGSLGETASEKQEAFVSSRLAALRKSDCKPD